MPHINIEIKARCNNQDEIRKILKSQNAIYAGLDHQIDTYFKVPKGRLKLREGNIENFLIHYKRENQKEQKQSDIILFRNSENTGTKGTGLVLKQILSASLDVLAVVDKQREIYFIENVKFHLDHVKDLGKFLEIEAIDKTGEIGIEKLNEQCKFYRNLFNINDGSLISESYSDLLLRTENESKN
jgi:adenylate cyclase, class 2